MEIKKGLLIGGGEYFFVRAYPLNFTQQIQISSIRRQGKIQTILESEYILREGEAFYAGGELAGRGVVLAVAGREVDVAERFRDLGRATSPASGASAWITRAD